MSPEEPNGIGMVVCRTFLALSFEVAGLPFQVSHQETVQMVSRHLQGEVEGIQGTHSLMVCYINANHGHTPIC